jgi:hypothetical protein
MALAALEPLGIRVPPRNQAPEDSARVSVAHSAPREDRPGPADPRAAAGLPLEPKAAMNLARRSGAPVEGRPRSIVQVAPWKYLLKVETRVRHLAVLVELPPVMIAPAFVASPAPQIRPLTPGKATPGPMAPPGAMAPHLPVFREKPTAPPAPNLVGSALPSGRLRRSWVAWRPVNARSSRLPFRPQAG